MRERTFYDMTAPLPVIVEDMPTHDVLVYELEGTVFIEIRKEEYENVRNPL